MNKGLLYAVVVTALVRPDSALGDDMLFYSLGGGEIINRGPSNRQTVAVGASVAWDADLVCGDFDMSLSIKEQLNGVKGAYRDVLDNVVTSVTGAIASAPGLILKKVNPMLFDELQNGVRQASKEFHIAKTSCQDIVDYFDEEADDGFGALAKAEYFKGEAHNGNAELLETSENAEALGRDQGVSSVGGVRKGGRNQPPIKPHSDVVKAGYNLLLGRSANDTGQITNNCNDAPLCTMFSSPQEQADWLVDVIGERRIQICDGCQSDSMAGLGLQRKVGVITDEIVTDLSALVASSTPPTAAKLLDVSASPTLGISRRVVEAIREENPENQSAIIARISSEMAFARTIEAALMARRSLIAGMGEPNIENAEPYVKPIRQAVEELNAEIENMLYETEVRARIAQGTASALLMRSNIRNNVPIPEYIDPGALKDGARHE